MFVPPSMQPVQSTHGGRRSRGGVHQQAVDESTAAALFAAYPSTCPDRVGALMT